MPVPVPVHRPSLCPSVCLSGSLHVCLCRCVPSKPAYPVSQTTSEQRQGAGDATIRKIQYRIMGLCSALLLLFLLLLLYLVCRYGGTKLHIAAALCRRLCGHSLLSFSLSLLLLVLLLVCVFCLFFSFFDLIENLENQVNSLGDSRQCICG